MRNTAGPFRCAVPGAAPAGRQPELADQSIGWLVPPANPPRPLDVHGVPPVLIVNATHDANTSYKWAHVVAGQIRRSVVFTRLGDGTPRTSSHPAPAPWSTATSSIARSQSRRRSVPTDRRRPQPRSRPGCRPATRTGATASGNTTRRCTRTRRSCCTCGTRHCRTDRLRARRDRQHPCRKVASSSCDTPSPNNAGHSGRVAA
jgi:hypothetical protein